MGMHSSIISHHLWTTWAPKFTPFLSNFGRQDKYDKDSTPCGDSSLGENFFFFFIVNNNEIWNILASRTSFSIPQMALNTKHHSQKVADETEWEQTWQIP